MTQTTNRITGLVRSLLDQGYERAVGPVLQSIGGTLTSGIVAQRLGELDAEAARLEAAGERMRADNPVLRALLADLDTELRRTAARIDVGADAAQRAALDAAGRLTRELALPGVTDAQLAAVGVRWNTPDPEAVNALVNYTASDGWREEMASYPGLIADTVRNQAVRGIVEGWGPLTTARAIRQATEGFSVAQANNLMRTLQLTSYRDAAVLHRVANADILQEQIRIAALDARTCMACIALHGTRLPIDERINDHHQGRCTSIAVVRGFPREVQSGEAWFNGLAEASQRAQMGNAAFEAWQAGRISLQDFPQRYDDRVFGEMVREASLKGMLGGSTRTTSIPPAPAPPAWSYLPEDRVRRFGRYTVDEAAAETWADSLSDGERQGIRYWAEAGYREFRALGRGVQLSAFSVAPRYYDNFVQAVRRAPIFEGVSWRGVSISGERETLFEQFRRQVGTRLTWDTWSSASANAEVGGSFTRGSGDVPVLFEVYSRQGRWINQAAPRAGTQNDEYELLFSPNTNFRVRQVFNGRYDSPFGEKNVIIVVLEDED